MDKGLIKSVGNFGDGIASNDPKVNHTFAAGTYTVTLRVSDASTVVEDTQQIVVTAPPVIENPTGYFSHSAIATR